MKHSIVLLFLTAIFFNNRESKYFIAYKYITEDTSLQSRIISAFNDKNIKNGIPGVKNKIRFLDCSHFCSGRDSQFLKLDEKSRNPLDYEEVHFFKSYMD